MKILILLLCSFSLYAQELTNNLTIFVAPSPKGIDWTTPGSLARSYAKNKLSFEENFLGAVYTEFQCGKNYELISARAIDVDIAGQLLLQGRGLGILYHTFDGELIDKQSAKAQLSSLIKTPQVRFIRFAVNEAQCHRMSTFLKEYREKDIGKLFGLPHRPLYGEGGTDTALAMAFMEVAGIMTAEYQKDWSRTLLIPLRLAGPPVKEETVSIWRLFGAQWATLNEPYQALVFWDKEKIFNWIMAQRAPVKMLEKAQGIEIDRSYMPAPQGPVWQQASDPIYQK